MPQARVLSFTVQIWKLGLSSQECKSRKELRLLSVPVSEHHLQQQFLLGRAWRRKLGLSLLGDTKSRRWAQDCVEKGAGRIRQGLDGMTRETWLRERAETLVIRSSGKNVEGLSGFLRDYGLTSRSGDMIRLPPAPLWSWSLGCLCSQLICLPIPHFG